MTHDSVANVERAKKFGLSFTEKGCLFYGQNTV